MLAVDPLVSVIMPVYNAERTLPYAIESVLAQTLTDIELVIVDDASTDSTPLIIDYYGSLDPRLRAVRNPANSRSAKVEWEPRNDGLRIARGSLIGYLDGDNSWDRRMLRTMADALTSRPEIQLAYCRSRNFHDPGDIDMVIARDERTAVSRGSDWVVFAQGELDPPELGRRQYVDANEIVHRSSVFGSLGSLWRTFHPRREWVGAHQGKRCEHRRHNDLDLVERIVHAFGVEAVLQVPQILVNFYYPSATSRPATTMWTAPPGRVGTLGVTE